MVGAPFNPSQASEDLRAIFSLGFFDDVQLKVEDFEGGVKLTFVVIERPFVRDVEFTGNSRLSTADLQEKIDLKLGSVYNPVDVQRAKEKLKEAYEDEGYFEVQISPAVEKFGDGDVKVVFTVNEGRRITIEKIVFRGNKGLQGQQHQGRHDHQGASVLHPARDGPAPEARGGHRAHRRPLQRQRLRPDAGGAVRHRRSTGRRPG